LISQDRAELLVEDQFSGLRDPEPIGTASVLNLDFPVTLEQINRPDQAHFWCRIF